jgi:hypothetical protein
MSATLKMLSPGFTMVACLITKVIHLPPFLSFGLNKEIDKVLDTKKTSYQIGKKSMTKQGSYLNRILPPKQVRYTLPASLDRFKGYYSFLSTLSFYFSNVKCIPEFLKKEHTLP